MSKANWGELLLLEANDRGDDLSSLVWSFPQEEISREFDNDFGAENGTPFYAWTNRRVYFAVSYDGAEWVGSAPRNPCDEEAIHHGG